jgi:serine phosphatase RsbU (regulator of sigma subunit)
MRERLRIFHALPIAERDSYWIVSAGKLRDTLQRVPFSQLGLDEITDLYMDMGIVARQKGIGALNEIAGLSDDELFDQSLRLLIRGERPQQIWSILQPQIEDRLKDDELRYRMVLQGISSLQAGSGRGAIERTLWLLYLSERYGAAAFKTGAGVLLLGLILASGYAVKKRRELRRAEQLLIQEMEGELQTAHDMQMGLMPKEHPQAQGFDIAGRCMPASEVGGDFFQYFDHGGRLSIALADVTGKAMAATIPVVLFDGALESQVRRGQPVRALFAELNRTLHHVLDSRTFVCFTMGELDPSTRMLRLCNGGCPYPYHFKALSGEVTELQQDAYPLGVRTDTEYEVIETELDPGDRVVFCSDGIAEAENEDGEQFGYERTAETVRQTCSERLNPEATIDSLLEAVAAFRGDAPQSDDMTCVVVRVEEE